MKKKEPNNSLWAYTQDRKWRPLHNTDAFDGYKKEGVHFESIKYNNGNVTISKLINEEMSPEVLKINKIAENKTYEVGYYFWMGDNNIFYLMRENNDTTHSVWNYTKDRKWQPIHNADAFDGFPKASSTIESISLDKNSSILSFGKATIKPMDYTINLSSSDLDESRHYHSEFFSLSPALSWVADDNLKKKVKNFIIVMRNVKTNDLIWSKTLSGKENNISKGAKGDTRAIPSSSFCSKVYKNKATKEKILDVSIAIYAIDNPNILGDIKCFSKVENENIASSEINATLDVSILSNEVGKFYEHSNNDGSIKNRLVLEFKDGNFSETNNPSFLKILNLPDGLTSSYDIDNKEIYITLVGKAKDDEGIKEIIIILDGEIWNNQSSNQTISTSISFLDNARSIDDIKQEEYYKYSWHQNPLDFLGSAPISSESHSNIEKAWEITRGKGVVVAIIDTSFDFYHDDLEENFQSSYNGATGTTDVYPPDAGSSHGTLVAGAVGAAVNGRGVVGSAPEAKMLFINFPFTGGRASDIVKAFSYAQDNGAKVINCSWGSSFVADAVKAKIKELHDEGVIILFATGNDNVNLDYVNSSAAQSKLPTVLAVGASSEVNGRAPYSNYGSELDFVAPAGKYGIPTTDVSGSAGGNAGQGLLDNDYGFAAGTSLATPVSAGIVALMVSVNPDITPNEARVIIRETADKIVGGYNSDGFNIELGFGKINAYKAVSRAKAMKK